MAFASGCAGVACATITASAFGSVYATTTSDGNGNYSLSLTLGSATSVITPSLNNYTFVPASTTVNINTNPNNPGVNFVASNSTAWSSEDCRDSANYPNSSINENGTQMNTAVKTESRVSGPPVDSRVTKPQDCRVSPNIPLNSRNTEV